MERPVFFQPSGGYTLLTSSCSLAMVWPLLIPFLLRSFSLFKMCKKVSKNSLKSTWIGTQRIHGTGIFTYIWFIFMLIFNGTCR